MIEELVKVMANYGAIGVVLVASFWYIVRRDQAHSIEQEKLMERHYLEREKWSERMERMHNEAIEAQQKSTAVVTELVTLIRARNSV